MIVFDEKELFWAAGFLEGEGSFYSNDSGYTSQIRIQAVQTATTEPLERLQRLFGGNLVPVSREKERQKGSCNTKDNWRWSLYSDKAVIAMLHLYSLMSNKRKAQIQYAFRAMIPKEIDSNVFIESMRKTLGAYGATP